MSLPELPFVHVSLVNIILLFSSSRSRRPVLCVQAIDNPAEYLQRQPDTLFTGTDLGLSWQSWHL